MPPLKSTRAAIARLPTSAPLVVALVGGTTGIGSYTARALATTFANEGKKLRVYIVGRRADRAEEVIAYGRSTAPGSDWRFVQSHDLALLSEVARVSGEIIALEEKEPFGGGKPRIDVLYLSAALSPLQESPLTEEGVDSQMSLLYYSRIAFITHLTPLLLSSSPASPSHVISVFAGTMEAPNPTLGTPSPPSYGVATIRNNVCYMKTFAFEHLASLHAGRISFTHIYPGLVDGPTFYSDVNPLWFRLLWKVMGPVMGLLYMTSPEDCGTVMLGLATGRYAAKAEGEGVGDGDVAVSTLGERGGGCYAVGRFGDETGKVSWEGVRKGDTEKEVWEHTVGVIEGAARIGGA